MNIRMNELVRFCAGRTDTAGVRSRESGAGSSSPKSEALEFDCDFGFAFSHVKYCANANASDKAPLPSLLKKSKAWLRRLCWISSTNCCLTSSWFMIFENCINQFFFLKRLLIIIQLPKLFPAFL